MEWGLNYISDINRITQNSFSGKIFNYLQNSTVCMYDTKENIKKEKEKKEEFFFENGWRRKEKRRIKVTKEDFFFCCWLLSCWFCWFFFTTHTLYCIKDKTATICAEWNLDSFTKGIRISKANDWKWLLLKSGQIRSCCNFLFLLFGILSIVII